MLSICSLFLCFVLYEGCSPLWVNFPGSTCGLASASIGNGDTQGGWEGDGKGTCYSQHHLCWEVYLTVTSMSFKLASNWSIVVTALKKMTLGFKEYHLLSHLRVAVIPCYCQSLFISSASFLNVFY